MSTKFRNAIKNLVNNTGNRDANIQVIFDEVEPLCKTQTDFDGAETSLMDWLSDGQYHLTDTPKSLAEEWDEVNNPNNR